MKPKRAAVIGAGMAGVSAAKLLSAAGWDVVVFEKSRGWGGRCATKRIEGCIVDHGAQYFTMRDPEFDAAVRSACGDALCTIGASVVDAAGEKLEARTMFYHADGNSRLARALGADLDVRTAVEVAEVVGLEIGGEHFDTIVSTAPWPQTCKLAGIPIVSNPYAPCLAAIFAYDLPWEGTATQRYGVRDDSSQDLAWSACENHKCGRIADGLTVIVAHASETFSRARLEQAPVEWSAILRRRVEELWEIPPGALRHSYPHRWRYARVTQKIPPAGLPAHWIFAGDLLGASRVESAWIAGRDAVAHLL